ncbi:MAG: molybdopterin-dependent oxidoreductase, partial [Acidobacteriota bacterium]|nr:molybdopterin-dependent oxidoreductase [Acidobacteriota bacterium]
MKPPGKDPVDLEISRRTRRSLITGGIAAAAGLGLWGWIVNSPEEGGIQAPLRRGLQFNEKLSRDYFRGRRLAPEFPIEQAVKKVRVNEDIGMSEDIDRATWKVRIEGAQGQGAVDVPLAAIKQLPYAEHVTELKCVEGWSQIVHWGGARFADLAKRYPPPKGTQYVAMETPDGEYYVSLDLESALQPQTLLVYEMSGQPVTEEHGAPLRLCIPTKYGIKNIKQIGKIRY